MPAIGAVRQIALSAGRDLDTTLAFWRDVLGMAVHARFDPPGIAFIMAGDIRLL
ncbi:glyoxalase, partial [Mesorhizobium sp. M7A.T.Ca.TU.009.01.1.1]